MEISVIIPTYNRASLIERAIASVANQTSPPFEIIVVDDGSTDDTKKVVSSCIAKYSTSTMPIIYERREQGGAPVARNAGVALARGEWLAFLDSDDIWGARKLELQIQTLTEYAACSEACVTNASYVNNPQLKLSAFESAGTRCNSDYGLLHDIAAKVAYGYHGMYIQTMVVRKQLVLDVGGFDPALPLGDDSDLLFQIANRTLISYVRLPLVEIDRTPNRSTGIVELSRKENFYLTSCQYLYEKWLRDAHRLQPNIRRRVVRRLHETHAAWASWHLIEGKRGAALESLCTSVSYAKRPKALLKWLAIKCAPRTTKAVLLRRRRHLAKAPIL